MGDTPDRPRGEPGFDPRSTPVSRRSVLVLAGLAATGTGLGAVLAACAGPPVSITLDVDPAWLGVGTPREVAFTLVTASGNSVPGSTWLLKTAEGELVAYDPRCTHGLCRYAWKTDLAKFQCACHGGEFRLDGTVISGPPPKPLVRFPVREVDGRIVVDVPSDFQTPKESLPA